MSLQSILSGAAASPRIFSIDLPDQTPLRVADGDVKGAIPLEQAIDSGTGKWMYDQTAKSFGFNPATVRNNPEQHAKILERLGTTLDTLIAREKAGQGIADQHSDFRSALGSVTRTEDRAATTALNEKQLAAAASLPGASLFGNPVVQAILQAEVKVASNLPGAFGKAAQTGLAIGMAATVAGATYFATKGEGEIEAQLTPPTTTPPVDPKQPKTDLLAGAAAAKTLIEALDTDGDKKLQCEEIGTFVDDPQYASREVRQPNTNKYQDFISGHPGKHFVVPEPARATGEIAYDGCKDVPAGVRLDEAKADHGGMITQPWFQGADSLAKQGNEQVATATRLGAGLEWHAQVKADRDAINEVFREAGVPIKVKLTEMP